MIKIVFSGRDTALLSQGSILRVMAGGHRYQGDTLVDIPEDVWGAVVSLCVEGKKHARSLHGDFALTIAHNSDTEATVYGDVMAYDPSVNGYGYATVV